MPRHLPLGRWNGDDGSLYGGDPPLEKREKLEKRETLENKKNKKSFFFKNEMLTGEMDVESIDERLS